MEINYEDFEKVDIRVGKIIKVEDFPEARKPAYKLEIDFGPEIGTKKSSAQIVDLYVSRSERQTSASTSKNNRENEVRAGVYNKDELLGTLVLGVVNFPPKQIGPFVSECLTLGVPDEQGRVVLVRPDKNAEIGGKLF